MVALESKSREQHVKSEDDEMRRRKGGGNHLLSQMM